MRPEPVRKKPATRGRRLAKRPCDVQQACGVFPAEAAGVNTRKYAEFSPARAGLGLELAPGPSKSRRGFRRLFLDNDDADRRTFWRRYNRSESGPRSRS